MKRSQPLRAKRLPPEEVARRRRVKAEVYARDDCQCVIAPALPARSCWGGLTVHHIWKASSGGPYEESNLVTACKAHNDWVEIEPDRAHALGLVKRNGDTLAECWDKLRAAGLVRA